jgi:hypothetical protein
MKAKSIKGRSTEEIQTALQKSMADEYKPTLAIVFISIKQNRKAVCELLHQHEIDIIGATSSTEFIDGHQDEGSIVILLLDLNKAYYRILFQEVGQLNVSDAATQLAKDALKHFSNPAFIICSSGLSADGKMMDGETLIHSIEKVVGSHANMFGGMI